MAGGGGMNVVPEKVLVRINRLELGAIANIDESHILGICSQSVEEPKDVVAIKRDGDRLTGQRVDSGVQLRVQLQPVFGGSGVQSGRLRHVVLVVRNEPEWWNVRHENVKGAGPG